MVLIPGIWYKEINVSSFSEIKVNYGNKLVFDFIQLNERTFDSSAFECLPLEYLAFQLRCWLCPNR